MALDPETGAFTFDEWKPFDELRIEYLDIELSNTERAAIRPPTIAGEVLARIQAKAVDYYEFLRQAYIATNIDTDEGVLRARAIKQEMRFLAYQRDAWERLLSHIPEDESEGTES